MAVTLDIRTVNNRHLKVSVRGSNPYPFHEPHFEKIVRKQIQRGSVSIFVQVTRESAPKLQINTQALQSYINLISQTCNELGRNDLLASISSGALALPGVAPEVMDSHTLPEEEWPVVEKALLEALTKLRESRRTEGQGISAELLQLGQAISRELRLIRDHLPLVSTNYRDKLLERVRTVIGELGVRLEANDVIREVALFADRVDVHEEMSRLSAHLIQYEQISTSGAPDGVGRRLEFTVQEMGREINTLGSKAGDVTISRHVVEMKASLEKIRELIQNVE